MNFVHEHLRLGVNVDHVATVRNARGGVSPDPVRAAGLAAVAGADGITAHLREDRRHIVDADIRRLMEEVALPLNLEMAATDEMVAIALAHRPHAVCLVPERRAELTTEGGLDVAGVGAELSKRIALLAQAGIRVSLFVDPAIAQIEASKAAGAAVVELHTGSYCHAAGQARRMELERLQMAARAAHGLGLEVHAGHGLDYDSVIDVAAIAELAELNIGHFLIGEAIFEGLAQAIARMRAAIAVGRRQGAAN